jgi:tRNA-binding protein
MLTWEEFENVDMRVGTILTVGDFPEARNPSYKMTIDFGEIGIKKTSAQITKLYTKEKLVGREIIAVVNFPPKQIANFISECLVLGIVSDDKEVILLSVERPAKNGFRIH